MNYVERNKSNSKTADKSADEPRKSNQSFTGDKLDWMTAAAVDRRLKPSDFRVAFLIAQHINRKHREEAFPSEGLLADLVGCSVDTVKRAVKVLAKIGWLHIKRKRTLNPQTQAWTTRNIYRLRFENVQSKLDEITETRKRRRSKVARVRLSSSTDAPLTPETEHLSKRAIHTREGSKSAQVIKAEEEAAEWYKPQWSPSALMRMTSQLGYLVRLAECSTRH